VGNQVHAVVGKLGLQVPAKLLGPVGDAARLRQVRHTDAITGHNQRVLDARKITQQGEWSDLHPVKAEQPMHQYNRSARRKTHPDRPVRP